MGAELWHHETGWHDDPAAALREVQTGMLAEYDLDQLVPEHLASARQALSATIAEGNPYGLASFYGAEVRRLEEIGSSPIPGDPQARIRILRRIYANSGEGIGNVLDIEGISATRDIAQAQSLDAAECLRLVGTAQPTVNDARASLGRLIEELDRGECVCFPLYDDARSRPVGWQFVGITFD